MSVYVLHFDHPSGKVIHYIGCTKLEVEKRLAQHKSGKGARFTGKLIEKGYVPRVAHTFPQGDFTLEYRLKQLTRHRRGFQIKGWCPICKGPHPIPTEDQIMNWKTVGQGS